MPNNTPWDAPFPYDETDKVVQNYAEQNAQFLNNLERGYTPQQLNQAYNPPQYNAAIGQAPAQAPQQFQKSQLAQERKEAELQFARQMEQQGFVILDVPFYTDKQERCKAAHDLGVINEQHHSIVAKDVYQNTPELQIYGQDKRVYVNTGFETARQIQNEFQKVDQRNVLQFDRITGLNFLAGHTIADNPAILDYVKNFPNVHGVGTLQEVQQAKKLYQDERQKERWETIKNFQTQSYLKLNLPDGNAQSPQSQAFVQAFKQEAKSLGVDVLWDGKMKTWKLSAPENSQAFAVLANKYGSPAQTATMGNSAPTPQVSLNAAQLASQATAKAMPQQQAQAPQQNQQQQNWQSNAMNSVVNGIKSVFGRGSR